MDKSTRSEGYFPRGIVPALILSLLIHGTFFISILNNRFSPVAPNTPVTVVELVSENEIKTKQITSPSEQSKPEPPPKETLLESDKDSSVDKEQIKRGEPAQAAPSNVQSTPQLIKHQKPPPPKESKPSRIKREEPQNAQTNEGPKQSEKPQQKTGLTALRLDQGTLLSKFGESEKKPASDPLERNSQFDPRSYKAFSRPPGSGAAFLGSGGIRDYMPNLPDGDITLLNEKANVYASFVRRVATQVFTQLRSMGWESLNYGEVRSISDFTTVLAVMSPTGNFIRVELADGSGSRRFDDLLIESAKRGTKDSNPPKGALASDGTIRFIFKAKSWAEGYADPRNGAPVERRWLLLATGLE